LEVRVFINFLDPLLPDLLRHLTSPKYLLQLGYAQVSAAILGVKLLRYLIKQLERRLQTLLAEQTLPVYGGQDEFYIDLISTAVINHARVVLIYLSHDSVDFFLRLGIIHDLLVASNDCVEYL
jgi:hypothetical protein